MLRRAVAGHVPSFALRARALSTSNVRRPLPQSDFHELRERSLLQYVIAESKEGDAASVTAAMDTFWDTYFNGEGTAEWQLRVNALDQAIASKAPTTAMEIGTYCGYTAVRMGRLIPPGGKLISVEMDPLYAAIATKVRREQPCPPSPPISIDLDATMGPMNSPIPRMLLTLQALPCVWA